MSLEEVEHMKKANPTMHEVLGKFIVREAATRRVLYDVRAEVLELLYNQYKDEPGMTQHLLEIGVTLSELGEDEEYHQIDGRCGYLSDTNLCTAYEERPDVCRRFSAASKACVIMRDRVGIETPVELRSRGDRLCVTPV